MKFVFFILAIFCFSIIYGQLSFDEIDFKRIPQKKIRHYVINQTKNETRYISNLRASCRNKSDLSGLHTMQNTYLVKESPQIVWDAYISANMAKAWNGKILSFGLLCSKWSDYILYNNDDEYCAIDTGQVFFINLRILGGFYNLPVGVQVVNIDKTNRTITFSYLEGGKSIGTQTIRFIETPDGFTEVIHESAFKSSSHFRDKHLYPYYHTKVLNEFHRNIVKNIANRKDIFIVLTHTVNPD